MANEYFYRYLDGTVGTDPYQRDAQGNALRNAQGNTNAGTLLGRSNGQGGYTFNNMAGPGMPSSTANPVGPREVQAAGPYPVGQAQPSAATFGGGGGASGPNPYIQQQADALQQQSNQNLAQNVMPGIRSGALANGQYGGSRQAIAEGIAAGNAQAGVNAAQANLFSNGYATDQASQTQRMLGFGNLGLGFYNAGNSYNLGMGQLANNATAQNQQFYTQQRGQDLQQYQLGSNLFGGGVSGQLGVGSGQYGVGQQGYQAPLTALQNYANMLSPFSGLGGSQVTSGSSGGGLSGGLGGALAGAQLSRNLGLGSGAGSGSGWGTGAAYGNQDYGSFL